MIWLLEPDVFGPGAHPLREAVARAGHAAVDWQDDWWADERFPAATAEPALFHGSLGNAARIARLGRWRPGALCDASALSCSRWYPRFAEILIHQRYILSTVGALCQAPDAVAGALADAHGRVFVRPDSPLKPFSGRVVPLDGLCPADLDHGFYFDDLDLPIVVAPTRTLGREWRFVVAGGRVLADSAYLAEARQADGAEVPGEVRALADTLALERDSLPEPVCVLDLGEVDGELRLLEFNPFSGADLYACDLDAVVAGVTAAVLAPTPRAR